MKWNEKEEQSAEFNGTKNANLPIFGSDSLRNAAMWPSAKSTMWM